MNPNSIIGPTINHSKSFEPYQGSFRLHRESKESVSPIDSPMMPKIVSQTIISKEICFPSNLWNPIFQKPQNEAVVSPEFTINSFKKGLNTDLLKLHISNNNSLIMPFVRKFIARLKNASHFRNITSLIGANFGILNDSTAFFEQKTRKDAPKTNKLLLSAKNCFNSKFEALKKIKFVKKIGNFCKTHNLVLYPYQNAKILWDVFHLLLITYWLFFIPLLIVFDEVQNMEKTNSLLTIVFLILDIVLNLNTAYFKNGQIERRRKKILKNYWEHQLKSDLVTLLPLLVNTILGFNNTNKMRHLINFIFFIKIFTCQEIISRILEKFLLKEKFHHIVALLKTFCISLLVAHIFACFWYLTANLSVGTFPITWIAKADLQDASWQSKYLYAFYWAVVTMMTVGYGDISPTNEYETITCIVCVVLGCVVYAYNISSVGMILQELNKENVEFNHKINIINQFMLRKHVPPDLQRRIREYLSFLWKEENTQNLEEEQQIIDFLSSYLKEELYFEAYGSILNKHAMFFANFSEKSMRKVVSKIKEIRLFPEEKVFDENCEDDSAIYFVAKGKIELFAKKGSTEISMKELGVEEHFGEISFFTGGNRSFSARSKDFTTLFSITRQEFIDTLHKNPEDFEKFCMIKDQIMLYDNYLPLKSRCFCCNQIGHLANKCPLIHFFVDTEHLLMKHNFSLAQERNGHFKRRAHGKNKLLGEFTLKSVSEKLQLTILKEKPLLEQNTSSLVYTDYDEEKEEEETLKTKTYEEERSTTNLAIIKEEESKIFDNTENEILFLKKNAISKKFTTSLPTTEELKHDVQANENPRIISREFIHIETKKLNADINKDNLQTENDEFKSLKRKNTREKSNLTRMKSSVTNSHISEKINNENKLQESMDIVKYFKNYFPQENCLPIISLFNKRNLANGQTKVKEIQKKITETRQRLSKYTFFVDEMRKRMPEEVKRRVSITKRNKKHGQSIEDIRKTFEGKKKKKTFFYSGKKNTTSSGGRSFGDLIKSVVVSNSSSMKKKKKVNCNL